jgi:hypothetical protein
VRCTPCRRRTTVNARRLPAAPAPFR